MYIPTNFAPYKRIELLNTLTLTKNITCPVVEGITANDSPDLKTVAKFIMNRAWAEDIDKSTYIRIFELFNTQSGRWFLLGNGSRTNFRWYFENNTSRVGGSTGFNLNVGQEHEVIISSTSGTVDGIQYSDFSHFEKSPYNTTSRIIPLFQYTGCSWKSFEIYHKDELIRQYLPAECNKVQGFYETKTGVFCP